MDDVLEDIFNKINEIYSDYHFNWRVYVKMTSVFYTKFNLLLREKIKESCSNIYTIFGAKIIIDNTINKDYEVVGYWEID